MTNSVLFTPLELSNATEEYITEMQSGDKNDAPLYIPKMEYSKEKRKGFLPVSKGELITVVGRPGNGKTGFMMRHARMRAKYLREQNINEVALFFTLEQLVEQLRLFHVAGELEVSATDLIGNQINDWNPITNKLHDLHLTPLWMAGKSKKRRKFKVELNILSLRNTLTEIEKWIGDELELGIDSVYVDYLQRYRSNGRDFAQFYNDALNEIKDMAGDFNTRMYLGVQARREVDKYDFPMPLMEDGQWTSAIEQQSDGVITLMRPTHYKRVGESLGDLIAQENDLVINIAKRKNAPSDFWDVVKFAPEYNKLDEGELVNYNFRKSIGKDE